MFARTRERQRERERVVERERERKRKTETETVIETETETETECTHESVVSSLLRLSASQCFHVSPEEALVVQCPSTVRPTQVSRLGGFDLEIWGGGAAAVAGDSDCWYL